MPEITSFINDKSWLLINCQIVAWESGGLVGIATFTPNANEKLIRIVVDFGKAKDVYLDFENIDEFASRTVYEILETAQRQGIRRVYFVCSTDALRTHLLRYEGFALIGDRVFYRRRKVNLLRKLPERLRAAELSLARDACVRAFRCNQGNRMERLRSSLLLSNGLFDAGALAQNPRAFAWVSLLLSRVVRRRIALIDTAPDRVSPTRTIRIVSASLRGGVFAAAVAGLAAPALEFVPIDHFGPVTRLIERPRSITDALFECDAIMIADIVSGGTELKITRSFLEWHRWRLAATVSIASMWPPETYATVGLSIEPLFVLPREIPGLRLELPPLG